ncbi:MAG: SDR family oxidoreductase [Spirochaetes bacterium]|nr:SDR family oxidoreductase [Spirochaetota bacterium]
MKVEYDFNGKIALVTGASRGIGEAIARSLAAHGAEVILASRKIDALAGVEKAIKDAGGSAFSIACHTGEMKQIDALFEEIQKKYGRLDYLVNNAATNPYFGEVLNAEESAWEKTVSVNLKGYFFIAQKAARIMKDGGGGAIVNVASIRGVRPGPFEGIYSITKAGVISMTYSFARELAQYNIRTNCLLPGLTDTKFSSVLVNNEAMLNMAIQAIPLKRIAKPEDMVGAVLYLLSDYASYTTGTTVTVDGGVNL